jgi:hypothetical protein
MHAVSQVLVSLAAGRALPKNFFGGRIGIIALVVCDSRMSSSTSTQSLFITLAFDEKQSKEVYLCGGKLTAANDNA